MARYIELDALVAEIEKRQRILDLDSPFGIGGMIELELVKDILNTLEVKEVDLEKEYKEFVEEDPVYNKLVNGIVGKAIARHFFELGLKMNQKSE